MYILEFNSTITWTIQYKGISFSLLTLYPHFCFFVNERSCLIMFCCLEHMSQASFASPLLSVLSGAQLARVHTLTVSLIWHSAVMAERKRRMIWSYFTAVNENVSNCGVCIRMFTTVATPQTCFNIKKARERQLGAAAKKCLGTHIPPDSSLTVFQRQGISRHIQWSKYLSQTGLNRSLYSDIKITY